MVEYSQINYIDPKELKHYENNAKTHPRDQVQKLATLIENYGFPKGKAVIVDESLEIIHGHGRTLAAIEAGLKEVPYQIVTNISEADVKAWRISDNAVAESEWDLALLKEDLIALDELEYNLNDLCLNEELMEECEDLFNLDENTSNPEEDDEYDQIPEAEEKLVKEGDIWQLGRHFLLCGDSTNVEMVENFIGERTIDLCLTDPPYGINAVKIDGSGDGRIGGGSNIVKARRYRKVHGDSDTTIARAVIKHVKQIAKNYIIFGGNYFTDVLDPSPCWLVWDKGNGDNRFADAELMATSFKSPVRIYPWLWSGMFRQGEHKEERKTRMHPTQKPVGLLKNILNDYSSEEQIIYEPFAGSGSTLIACEATNRICLAVEHESHYCDIILERYSKHSNDKPKFIRNIS